MLDNIYKICLRAKKNMTEIDLHIYNLSERLDRPAIIWILAVAYRISLDIMYIYAISPAFSYLGLTLVPSSMKYIISIIIYLILFYIMPKKEMDFSSFFLNFQFAVMIAPLLSYYALNNQSTVYVLMVAGCVLLQTWIICYKKKSVNKYVCISHIQPYVSIVLAFVVMTSIAFSILYNGFAGLQIFDFGYLYYFREHREVPLIISYFVPWTYSAIIPFFIVLFLNGQKYINVIACCVLQLIMYMCTGARFAYLILFVVFFVYFLARWKILINGMFAGLICACIVATVFFKFNTISGIRSIVDTAAISIFGMRFLFIPALNKFSYYEFFSANVFSFFSDGQIGRLFSLSYPYQASLGRINAFSLGAANNAIAGYLGDSYAQAGFIGMLFISALLAFIIRFVSGAEKFYPFSVLTAIFISFLVILNDNALFTTLFTSGMLLLIFLFFIYRQPENYRNEGEL